MSAHSQQRTAIPSARSRIGTRRALALCLVAMFCLASRAQEIQFGEKRVPGKGHVSYAPEVTEVVAGKAQIVELRFRVDDGFHVNSHTPASELLIPTELTLDKAPGVKALAPEYPKGAPFKLAGDTLDVYQGEFRVRLRLVVPKGETTLRGGLRYQACDNAACFPPKTLPVVVAITGK